MHTEYEPNSRLERFSSFQGSHPYLNACIAVTAVVCGLLASSMVSHPSILVTNLFPPAFIPCVGIGLLLLCLLGSVYTVIAGVNGSLPSLPCLSVTDGLPMSFPMTAQRSQFKRIVCFMVDQQSHDSDVIIQINIDQEDMQLWQCRHLGLSHDTLNKALGSSPSTLFVFGMSDLDDYNSEDEEKSDELFARKVAMGLFRYTIKLEGMDCNNIHVMCIDQADVECLGRADSEAEAAPIMKQVIKYVTEGKAVSGRDNILAVLKVPNDTQSPDKQPLHEPVGASLR